MNIDLYGNLILEFLKQNNIKKDFNMVKAQEFWSYICEVAGYRFFSGVPCLGLNALYNKMSSEFMHYVPAVNEQIAVGIVNGAVMAGVKAAVLLDANIIPKIDLSFNIDHALPIMMIASCSEKPIFGKGIYSLEFSGNLQELIKVSKHIYSKNKPGVLFIRENIIL